MRILFGVLSFNYYVHSVWSVPRRVDNAVAMLEPVRDILNKTKVILASSSKPRKEILLNAGLEFDVVPSNVEENLDPTNFQSPGHFALQTALLKVEEVAKILTVDEKPYLIIGADTVVSFNGKIYGKPKSEREACTYLQELSGNTHTVFTGVVLKSPFQMCKFFVATDVKMANIDSKIIKAYVDTKEPLNKAGAYGIQGMGATIIEKVDGDYFNVVGLPLHPITKAMVQLCQEIKDKGNSTAHQQQ